MKNELKSENTHFLSSLIKRELNAVVFVRDYIQLQFDGITINYLLFPSIETEGAVLGIDHSEYRNKLCEQIGKEVSDFLAEQEELIIRFSDNSSIFLSFSYENIDLPEVIVIRDDKGGFQVF